MTTENSTPRALLEEAGRRLGRERGREYWKSLEELSGDPEFLEAALEAYPAQRDVLADPVARRAFLQVMGASLGLAGMGACTRQPEERIVPFASRPEATIPGKPLYFATAMPFASGALGLLVESHTGRPTKVEGNPEHPTSRGATDALAQASVLTLYDPDRAQAVTSGGRIRTYEEFLGSVGPILERAGAQAGRGLRVLSETVTSPTLARLMRELIAKYPQARWHQYEPVQRDNARAASLAAFGQDLSVRVDWQRAQCIASFGADFLGHAPSAVASVRGYTERRRAQAGQVASCRSYVVEPSPTITGAAADERLALAPAECVRALALLLRALEGDIAAADVTPAFDRGHERIVDWLNALARDLREHAGRGALLVGESLPVEAHVAGHQINDLLGNLGTVVRFGAPVDCAPIGQAESLRELVAAMRADTVELLVILGGNPVYDAPAELEFASALERVPLRAQLSLYEDETSERCHWHLPQTHFMEAWGDARAADGTASIVQPLIAPLYDGVSELTLAAALLGELSAKPYELVRATWRAHLEEDGDFERAWRRAVHDGVLPRTAEPDVAVTRRRGAQLERLAADGLTLTFAPDPSVWDGRFANNGWLQELPRPLTKMTWDNAALIGPATARSLRIESGDWLELEVDGRTLRAPAWILPAQAERCVTLHLGYGRWRAGRVGSGVGVNAYALRTSSNPWSANSLRVSKAGGKAAFALTQTHHSMEGRDLIRELDLAQYRAGAGHGEHAEHAEHISLYPEHPYDDNAWGMVIDLASCVGCNACVVACQAENNIPIVGKEQVAAGREMHWIRIDRYFKGDPEDARVRFQPVTCMHCENAPCEVVCPVAATVHSPEGLNEMVYNRCVGTRYCSNNCPYKVRRFNFFLYADWKTESLALQRNPDVDLGARGVMEKCSYCVQRISQGRIEAKKDGRAIRDGEVQTACQQVCPAQAITFGNINDPESRVAEKRREPHHYGLLTELNTKPRTSYLARLSNANPALAADAADAAAAANEAPGRGGEAAH